jgi:hypothetical protein
MFGWLRKKPDIAAGIENGLAEIRALDRPSLLQVQKGVDLGFKCLGSRFPAAHDWTFSTWEQKSATFDELGTLEKEWLQRDPLVSKGVWLVVASLAAIPMKSDIGIKIGKLMDELLLNKIEALGAAATGESAHDSWRRV